MTAPNRIRVKYFIHASEAVDLPALIPVFHRWIQENRIRDHLMVDVADYKHVHHGPGVVLVGHEADYAVDMAGGRPGLLYTRKRGWNDEDSVAEADLAQSRLRLALRYALEGAQALATEANSPLPGGFGTDEVEITFADRLHTPNQPEVYDALHAEIAAVISAAYADEKVSIERISDDPRRPLAFRVRTTQGPDIKTLLTRLQS